MKNRILSSTLLLLVGALFLVPAATPAHAQLTGVVCIIPSGSTTCPSGVATITGTVGSQLRVSVFIQASDGLNGFDIILLADHTIIKPASYDLTGTVLQGPQNVVEFCRGGVLVTGNTCQSTDTADTLHLTAVNCLGCPPTDTPTSGLLFTAIYNVTASSSGTPLGFQTGCPAPTSISGTCVTIANGSLTPDLETVQTATVSASAPASVPVNQTLAFDGVKATLTGSLSSTSSSVFGSITATITNVTTGAVLFSKMFNIAFALGSTMNPRFVMIAPVSPYTLGIGCSFSMINGHTSCDLTRDPNVSQSGAIKIVDVSMMGFAYGTAAGTARFNPALDIANQHFVDIVDYGIVLADYNAPVYT